MAKNIMKINEFDKENLLDTLDKLQKLWEENREVVELTHLNNKGMRSSQVATVILYLIKLGIIPVKIKIDCDTCGTKLDKSSCSGCDDFFSNWSPRKKKIK